MKKIYAFTLENDDVPSKRFKSDLRLIAYLMYDLIYNYDGENSTALDINRNIVYNSIIEVGGGSEYYLNSDIYDDGCINYEPFIVGEHTFGLTINDNLMDENTLYDLMQQVLLLIGCNYNIRINSEIYFAKNIDDERYRRKAIQSIYNRVGCAITKKNLFCRKRVLNSRVNVGLSGR